MADVIGKASDDETPVTDKVTVSDIAELPPILGEGAEGSVAEQVRPRTLVPTPRQGGQSVPDEPLVGKIGKKGPKVPWPTQLWGLIKDLDPRGIQGPKIPILVFTVGGLLGGLDDAVLGIIGPELRAEFGVSIGVLLLVGQLNQFVAYLSGIPAGYLADRVKRVLLVRIGAITTQLGSLIVPFTSTYTQMTLAQSVTGLFGNVDHAAVFPLMADYYPARVRARVIAFRLTASRLFGIAVLPILGYVVLRVNWRPALFILGLVATGAAALTFLLKEPVRGSMDRLELGLSPSLAMKEQEPMSFQESLRAAWAIRTMRRQFYSTAVASLASPVGTVLGFYTAEKFLLNPFQRSLILSITQIVTLPTILVSAAFVDRLLVHRPSRVMVLQGAIGIVGMLSIPLTLIAPNIWFLLPFNIMLAYVSAIPALAASVMGTMVIPARVRGLGLQVFALIYYPVNAVASILVIAFQDLPLSTVLLLFMPFQLIGGIIAISAASSVEKDIRAARAAAIATEEVERSATEGRNKMLVCRDLDVAYDGIEVLFNVDFDVEEGETVALLGTNGAGKSTLLKAIAGVHHAANGAILLDGRDVTHAPAHENASRGIVFMPGGQAVFPELTVAENLRTAGWLNRADEESVKQRTEEVLDLFPILKDRLDQVASSLSGGEQQMLALGQTFLMKPRMLMIDELSLGLAPSVVEQLLQIIDRIHKQGTTIVLVEQSLNVALTIAKRAVFMEKGRIVFDGPTDALLQRPDLVRSIFMGGAAYAKSRPPRRQYGEREVLLHVQNVSVSFGGIRALDEVSLDVAAGEIVGIIGPNGAGKTTLFDVISGHQDASGSVVLGETDLADLAPDARARLGLGRSFQSARLFPTLTVRENVAVALEKRAVTNPLHAAFWTPKGRRGERTIQSRTDGLIDLFGLRPYASKFVREISTGTRRAVEVACMVASEPKVLLLDEPSTGMAQAEIEALGPALSRIVRETGAGMLVIEHDIPLITSISDRLVAMDLGRVVLTGTPDEVRSHPRVLESYLAASDAVIQRSGSSMSNAVAGIRLDAELAGGVEAAVGEPEVEPLMNGKPKTTKRNR